MSISHENQELATLGNISAFVELIAKCERGKCQLFHD